MVSGITPHELCAVVGLLGLCLLVFGVACCVDRVCVMLERIHGWKEE